MGIFDNLDRDAIWMLVKVHASMLTIEICWGVLNVWGKLAMEYFEPVTLGAFRGLGSLPVVLVLATMLDQESFYDSLANWRTSVKNILLLVGLPQSLSFVLYHYGLHLSEPVNCSLLWLSITPITAFLGMLFNREPRSWIKVLGVLSAVGGALVTMDLGNYSVGGTSFIGDILVICSAFCYSCYLLFTHELSEGMGAWTLTVWYFAGVSLFTGMAIPPIYFTIGVVNNIYVPLSGWGALILIVTIGTTFPYILNNWAIKHSSPLLIAMYTPVEMLSTVVFASIVLGEKLKWQQGVGSIFILIGLAIVTYAKYKDTAKEEEQQKKFADEDHMTIDETSEVNLSEGEALRKYLD